MVRYQEEDTKPHHIPEYERKTLPIRAEDHRNTQLAVDASGQERLEALSEVLSATPDNLDARRGMYLTLYRYLQRYPFLRYLEENDLLYQVITGQGRVIKVPKDRAVTPQYPPKQITPLQRSYRWLAFSLFGLLLAGLGALICAPVAASFAWQAARAAQNVDNRNRAEMALIYAFSLFGVGLLFGFLFVLHL